MHFCRVECALQWSLCQATTSINFSLSSHSHVSLYKTLDKKKQVMVTFFAVPFALCISAGRTPPHSLLVGWDNQHQIPGSARKR